jgi:hypothetical protein
LPARVLTDAEVRGLRAEGDQRLGIYDAKARGLCLRVTARTKSWSFVYRPHGSSQQRRYTIGDYPAWSLSAARDKALTLRRQVQDGGDPVVEVKTRNEALTVVSMIERFLDRAKHRLRSWRTYEDLLNRDIVPTIGARRAGDVTRAEVANVLDKVAARAPVVANQRQRGGRLPRRRAWERRGSGEKPPALCQAAQRGDALGLNEDEVAFYDALETNDSAVKVLGDDALRTIACELVATVTDTALHP